MTAGALAPRIYVACLPCYNAGRLVGAWIDCDQDAEEIREEIAAMLRGEHAGMVGTHAPHAYGLPCEEWRIDDTEGLPCNAYREGIEAISALGQGIAEHGDAFSEWFGLGWTYGIEPDEWAERFRDAYRGEWDSAADYAEDVMESCGFLSECPPPLRHHIDFDGLADEMVSQGIVFARRGRTVFAFDGCAS